MLIWIRSQDRKILAAVDTVEIIKQYHQYNQVTYELWSYERMLGTYATSERAMEVLNDIQNAVEKQMKIFQMPKE